jgi:FAD/FMN-containing dehydrogenase
MGQTLPVHSGLVEHLRSVVGAAHVLADPETRAGYETDWTRRFSGRAVAVVRPGSPAEVAAVVGACRSAGVGVVPQGGNTGLVGGGVPGPDPAVVVSTGRLDRLGPLDAAAQQVTVGAGVTLARLQAAARAGGLAFPVDLAARDSATVGGMVATNAGGLHVLRYGSTRAQVVGLEAVLADGSVISRLSGLVKDNTGYDLSQLMVGSEGTLGIVTAARLRLVPEPTGRVVALVGVGSTVAAVDLVRTVRRSAEGLSAAEVIYGDGLALVCEHAGLPAPLRRRWPVYVVLEAVGGDPTEELFSALAGAGADDDATAVAADPAGAERLWAYRERQPEAVAALGVPHKLDVTLPAARLADFEAEVRRVVAATAPGATTWIWGHLGDGNLHVNVIGPDPADEAVDAAVLELVAAFDGSISAEHGIGRAKAAWLHLSRSPAERAAMRAIKSALDPDGVLNPGVLLA